MASEYNYDNVNNVNNVNNGINDNNLIKIEDYLNNIF